MSGWIKFHRKITEWEWFSDHNTFRLFTYLLLSANHKQQNWRGVCINAGQLITSVESLSKKTGLSFQQIRTSLKKLKSTGEITSLSTSKYTVISITYWNLYQSEEQPTKQTSNKRATTNKNDNNDKKSINTYSDDFLSFMSVYPSNMNKSKAYKCYQTAIKETDHEAIISGAIAYADYCKRANTEKRFIAHAATWLNQRRWENEYSTMDVGPVTKGLHVNASKRGIAAIEAAADKILSQAGRYMD